MLWNSVQQEVILLLLSLTSMMVLTSNGNREIRRILNKYKDYDFEGKRQEVVALGNAGTESPIRSTTLHC